MTLIVRFLQPNLTNIDSVYLLLTSYIVYKFALFYEYLNRFEKYHSVEKSFSKLLEKNYFLVKEIQKTVIVRRIETSNFYFAISTP